MVKLSTEHLALVIVIKVKHNFAELSTCGLRKGEEMWGPPAGQIQICSHHPSHCVMLV